MGLDIGQVPLKARSGVPRESLAEDLLGVTLMSIRDL